MNSEISTSLMETEVGLIPQDWDILSIQDVSEVVGGGTPSTGDIRNFGGDISWITPKDLSGYSRRHITCGSRNITERGLNSSNAKLIPAGSVLLTTRAPVGYLAIAENEVTTNQGFHSMIPNERTDSQFLFYLLKNNVQKLVDHASGSTFQELSGRTLKVLAFAFPDVAEQKRIAEILSSLDDKIELDRQINANLEKLASALFKNWFVDFEFPDKNGKPYKSSGGKMVDSEMGEIPEGWKAGELTDVCEFNPAYSLPKGTIAKYAEMKDLPETGISIRNFIDREFKSGSKFANHDTLLARITPCLENGKTGYVDFLSDSEIGWGSTEFIVLHPARRELSEFLYILSRLDSFREHAIQSMSGSSGRQRVQINSLVNYRIIVPDKLTILKFHELVRPLFEQIKFNFDQSKRLTEVRDSLLPRLMSGKIRVQ